MGWVLGDGNRMNTDDERTRYEFGVQMKKTLKGTRQSTGGKVKREPSVGEVADAPPQSCVVWGTLVLQSCILQDSTFPLRTG